MKIGVLSDTHDLLRPDVIETLQGCEYIFHAGDISSPSILDRIYQIAPVKAVRSNNEKEGTECLPLFLDFELDGMHVFMTHKKKDFPKDTSAYDLMICDNSHQYAEARAGHTLLLNPGNIKAQIELVIRETQKGRGPREIAQRSGLDPALTEQIARLYVIYPGVTADGIMTKMGL